METDSVQPVVVKFIKRYFASKNIVTHNVEEIVWFKFCQKLNFYCMENKIEKPCESELILWVTNEFKDFKFVPELNSLQIACNYLTKVCNLCYLRIFESKDTTFYKQIQEGVEVVLFI